MSATCPPTLTPLGCDQTGVGFLSMAWNLADTSLHLRAGMGASFPIPSSATSYWVDLGGCGCCARVQVTGRVGDVLTIVPPPATGCTCISSNTRVAYASNSPEHMRELAKEVGINVVSPLVWNCATRTLSLDCAALKDLVNLPCV
jgi:hypothetical protein